MSDRRLDRCVEDQEENRPPVAEGKARDLLSRHAVGDVDAVVAMQVAICGESGDAISQVALPSGLGPECHAAHARVQAVGPNDQIEPATWRAIELHREALRVLAQRMYFVAEDGLHPTVQGRIELRGQIAAKDTDEAIVQHLAEFIGAKTANSPAFIVDDPDFAHSVAHLPKLRNEPHPLRDVETHPPKIHDIAARAQRGRALDQGRNEAVAGKPISERRAGDAGAGDKDRVSFIHAPRPVYFSPAGGAAACDMSSTIGPGYKGAVSLCDWRWRRQAPNMPTSRGRRAARGR